MMLNKGKHGSERILSRPSVETMTTDQLTPAQKAASGGFAEYWDSHGWGFGVSVVTRRDDLSAVPGRYGWDGGQKVLEHSGHEQAVHPPRGGVLSTRTRLPSGDWMCAWMCAVRALWHGCGSG